MRLTSFNEDFVKITGWMSESVRSGPCRRGVSCECEVKPGVRLVYLDNAATSQKPRQVLGELNRFYGSDNSSWMRFSVCFLFFGGGEVGHV